MSTMTLLDSPQVIKSVYDDANQALRVSGGFELQGFIYAHISTSTSTPVKVGAGVLSSLSVNKAGASSNIATIYDGLDAGGEVIAIVDTDSLRQLTFDVSFSVGLFIVTATGTQADLTVAYA